VGWPRVANDLSDINIPTEVLGEYDPVDMAGSIPDAEAAVATQVTEIVIMGPEYEPNQNLDYDTFWRMSWYDRITAQTGNTRTIFNRPSRFFATHGSLGGTPGYNDGWESSHTAYLYALDRTESMRADRYFCGILRARLNIVIRNISDSEYGFPLNNPTTIP